MNEPWTSVSGWLLHNAVGGSLVLLLTFLLMHWTRQPARRQRLGEFGLLAAMLVGLLSLVGPSWLVVAWHPRSGAQHEVTADGQPFAAKLVPPLDTAPPEAGPQIVDKAVAPDLAEAADLAEIPATSLAQNSGLTEALTRWIESGIAVMVAGFVVVAGFLTLRLGLGYLALTRLVGRSEAAPPQVRNLFETMAAGARWVRLVVSGRVLVPLSCGVVKPTVVLPSGMCERAGARQLRWIFAHELTHLRRRDAWSALLFGVGQILFFFVPWFWWLRRQVRLCQEYVADAAAAAQDDQAVLYAEFLVSLAGTPAVPTGASAVSGQGSDLYRRVTMLLQDPLRVETRCPRRWTVFAAGGLLAVAVLVAGFGYRAEAAADDTIVIIIRPDGDKTAGQKKQTVRVYVAPANAGNQTSKNLVQGDQAARVLDDLDRTLPLAEILTNDASRTEAAQLLLQLQNQAVRSDQEKLKPPTIDGQDKNKQQLMETLEELKRVLNELEKGKPSNSLADVINRVTRVTQDQPMARVQLDRTYAPSSKPAWPRLGASVETISPVLKEQLGLPGNVGVVVTKVQPGSAAEKAGIQANDVLLKIDGAMVPSDLEDFQKLITALKSDTPFDVVVMRKGQTQKVGSLTLVAETAGPAAEKALERKAVLAERKIYLEALNRLNKSDKLLLDKKGKDKDTVTTIVTRKGNAISVKHQEDGTVFTLNANLKDDMLEIGAITVEDAQGVHNYKTVSDLPESLRGRVRQIAEMVARGIGSKDSK